MTYESLKTMHPGSRYVTESRSARDVQAAWLTPHPHTIVLKETSEVLHPASGYMLLRNDVAEKLAQRVLGTTAVQASRAHRTRLDKNL
jgi:hypothetical protein